MENSKARRPGQNKRFWTEDEDKALIESLLEIQEEGKYKAGGKFKAGHLKVLERKLQEKIPGCDLEANPNIGSRLKTLKSNFQTVNEMLTGPNCDSFRWNSEKQTIIAEKPVWDAYLKTHKDATPFRYKPFPYYDVLCLIYGNKDCSTGKNSEGPTDVIEELDRQEEEEEKEKEEEKENSKEIYLENNVENEDVDSANNDQAMDEHEAQSISHSATTAQARLTRSDGSSKSLKKKRKISEREDLFKALKESSMLIAQVIENASARLSRAIGEDMNEKHMKLGSELERTTTLTTTARHKVARMIMKDNALVSYFFSIADENRDEWVRGLLAGDF